MIQLSDQDLAAAVELNQAHWLRLEGQLPWVKFNDDGDVLRVFAGDTWPRNRVALARFLPATAHQRIGEILAPHLEHKVACNWVVGPISEPPDLGRHLRAHGFHCMIHCPGMSRDLGTLPADPGCPAGFKIRPADQPARLRPLTTERRRRNYEGLTSVVRQSPRPLWFFIASQGDRQVGGAVLLTAAGVAGIYGVEVLKDFRRRGLGAALVFAALRKARQLRLPAAVLSASGLGLNVYQRLGFREVCRLSFWRFGKMRQRT
jgi:GNAT superfamily N-acetyltransferase